MYLSNHRKTGTSALGLRALLRPIRIVAILLALITGACVERVVQDKPWPRHRVATWETIPDAIYYPQARNLTNLYPTL